MRINDEHWFEGVTRVPSPNCDCRSNPTDVSLVVLHCISLPEGHYGTGCVEDLFCNRLDCSSHVSFADLEHVEVSAHLFLTRRGRVIQFVPFNARAWHAGVSSYRGRSGCNDYSIGIELEGTAHSTYTKSQYRKLGRVLRALFARYPRLSPDAVVGHQEIAPGRKIDPGPGFDWSACLRSLHLELESI